MHLNRLATHPVVRRTAGCRAHRFRCCQSAFSVRLSDKRYLTDCNRVLLKRETQNVFKAFISFDEMCFAYIFAREAVSGSGLAPAASAFRAKTAKLFDLKKRCLSFELMKKQSDAQRLIACYESSVEATK